MLGLLAKVILRWLAGRPCPVLRIRSRTELIRFMTRDPNDGTVEMVILDIQNINRADQPPL